MAKKKPEKPTEPYGYISFGKDGKVEKKMFMLSKVKEHQERGVIESFSSYFPNDFSEHEIQCIEDLPEADQDFVLKTNLGSISVQLTEIVEREYAFKISIEDYDSGKYNEHIFSAPGEIPLAVDQEKRDDSITAAIKRKVLKNYAKGQSEQLWLVIFSTSLYLTTVFVEGGKTRSSRAYENAVSYIQSECIELFDQVWYYNLQTRPVRIWPRE